jgi:hypothetical protein
MKKLVALILLMCMILTLAACTDNGSKTPESTAAESTAAASTAPEITMQEVYDAGKNLTALLGDHESVYVQITSNGNIIREEYLSKQHCYSFSSPEYMDMGFEYADFTTAGAEYICFENSYLRNVTLTPNGMVDAKERFAAVGTVDFVSSIVAQQDAADIDEQDGFIIVTYTADIDEIETMGKDVVSCVETYTLDAKTREMTSVTTVYTYQDGTVEEGIATITRDVEVPEGAKPFLAYEQKSEAVRTVTIVSNPGDETEKSESITVPKGLAVGFSPDWTVGKDFAMYADAACTQAIEADPDVNSDVTVYIKWAE